MIKCLFLYRFYKCLLNPDSAIIGLALTLLIATGPSQGATLTQIKSRNTLVVGVKTDYPPFGQLSSKGQMQGLEHDMAEDLAKRLGVVLKKVSVTGANRLQKLEEGTVDILIATLGDTAERRKLATLVEPGYYESGATLIVDPFSTIKSWTDLQGKTICISQGGYFNGPMAQQYLFTPLTFNTPSEAKLALRESRCSGYLYDNIAAWTELKKPEWSGYQMPLVAEKTVTWAIALPITESESALEVLISDTIIDWHRQGFILALEKKWQLPASSYVANMHTLWSQKSADGKAYICTKNTQGIWPSRCQSSTTLTAHKQKNTALSLVGLDFKEFSGIDLSFVYKDYDRLRFLAGLKGSILLMLSTMVLSLILGFCSTFIVELDKKIPKKIVQLLAIYAGMTPPLLQIYILLFGIGSILKESFQLQLTTWFVAVFCLSFYTASSVMRALLESCQHLRRQNPFFCLQISSSQSIAQAYQGAAGSISASLINVSKASMIASAIAVPELLSATTSIMLDSGNTSEMMNALLVTFVVLIAVSNRLIKELEKRLLKKVAAIYE